MAAPIINTAAARKANVLRKQHEFEKTQAEQRIQQLEEELAIWRARLDDMKAEDEFYEQVLTPAVERYKEIHGADPVEVRK